MEAKSFLEAAGQHLRPQARDEAEPRAVAPELALHSSVRLVSRSDLMPARRNITPCVYCGGDEDMTRDHVPPRNLFPSPRPSNLITVPCCRECNRGFSRDDEFFRTAIACAECSSSHPEAVKLWNAKIRRQLTRGGRGAIRELIRQTFGTSGPVTTVNVKQTDLRLARCVKRIVKGLFFHDRGEPLPRSSVIRMDLDVDWGVSSECRTFAATHRDGGHHFGDGVFSYWSTPIDSSAGNAGWLLLFYESIPIRCAVAPY
jgi:hypothetical protein